MKSKILFCIIILAILSICKPNFRFLQTMEINGINQFVIKDNTDLSFYRKMPQKYFSILRRKHEGIDNLYVSFFVLNSEDTLIEAFIKNNLKKKTLHVKSNDQYKEAMTTLKRGKKIYAYQGDKASLTKFAMDMSKVEKFKSFNPISMLIAPIPQDNFNYYRYIGTKNYKDRSCALWQGKIHNKNTNSTDISNICFDEELGITLYHTIYNDKAKTRTELVTINEINTDEINNKEFYIPKHIKAIMNGNILISSNIKNEEY